MPQNAVLANFTKTYLPEPGRTYLHTATVRHKGTVIAFAMDSERRIRYRVLNLSDNPADAANTTPPSPFDRDAWLTNPEDLVFPAEIAEVGFGVAGNTLLPVFKRNKTAPEAPGTVLPAPDGAARRRFDYFRSTTARLTASAPFQVLSDGQYIYLFRQAVSGSDSSNVLKTNAKDKPVLDKNGQPVPLVDATLLVDRFVLTDAKLMPKLEVRFQRSRSRTRPANRKDSLGPKDLDGNFFFEPTQELKFVGQLTGGRFSVLLLPTAVAGLQRWQIFAENSRSGRMDCFNVERSADGLFNTNGTPNPTADKKGHAESALEFIADNAHVVLHGGPLLGSAFTIEAWLKPQLREGATEPLALISSHGFADASRNRPEAAPSIWIERGTRLRVGFGDGDETWLEYTSKSLLTLDDWNHIAVSFDGATLRIYANGRLREKTTTAQSYFRGNLQPGPDGQPLQVLFSEKTLKTVKPRQPLNIIGNTQHSFCGTLDEIRVWQRVRSQSELSKDMGYRLTGLEPDLAAYWHFDEGSGSEMFNAVGSAVVDLDHGTSGSWGKGFFVAGELEWVVSDAPVGEHPGLQRSSFGIPNRSFASGPASLLYYQQSEAAAGYDGKKKPLKQSGRVMFAAATADGNPDNPNLVAALDLGVSPTGRLAQIPDTVGLTALTVKKLNALSTDAAISGQINDTLSSIAQLQAEYALLDEDVARLSPLLDKLAAAIAEPPSLTPNIVADIQDNALDGLNEQLTGLKTALVETQKGKDAAQALLNAKVTVFEHFDFGGASIGASGFMPDTPKVFNFFSENTSFNHAISSLKISGPVQAVLVNDDGVRSQPFTADTPSVGNEWNDRATRLEITEMPAHTIFRNAAAVHEVVVPKIRAALTAARATIQTEHDTKKASRDNLLTDLDLKQKLVRSGASAVMNFVSIDPHGLSTSGGLLDFAWTKADSAPLLFDSATGSLAMYFQGTSDQFFVAYYDTRTERARYLLEAESGAKILRCTARSADAGMDEIEIAVSDTAGDPATCQLLIAGPTGFTETWLKVPRDPAGFAKVLNGLAEERSFLGSGALSADGTVLNLDAAGTGAKRAVAAGETIAVGDVRFVVQQPVATGAKQILLKKTDPTKRTTTAPLPAFFIGYDYPANTSTTNLVADLYNGSMLLFAQAEPNAGSQIIKNQTVSAGVTLSCQWTADAPGTTLHFDGRQQMAQSADFGDAEKIQSFSPAGDVTLETWARPSRVAANARLLLHRSDTAAYTLGLERQELLSALKFRGPLGGVEDAVSAKVTGMATGNTPHTIEAWIRADELPINRSWPLVFGDIKTGAAHHWLLNPNGEIQIGAAFLSGQLKPKLPLNQWVHVASVFDGTQLSVFFNGVQQGASVAATFDLNGSNGLPLTLAKPFLGGPNLSFKGQIDDVRIWSKARTAEEILADMNRRLGGLETDLVGYWHFEGGAAVDFSRNKNHGTLIGSPTAVASPLSAYKVFAGVKGQMLRSRQVLPVGAWTHIAAAFVQEFGLKFDGESGYLDCGKDESLNLSTDLTLEVFLHADGWGNGGGLLAKGQMDDGTAQQTPYALRINAQGQVVFSYENVLGLNTSFTCPTVLEAGKPQRITVTRLTKTKSLTDSLGINTLTFGWHEIAFYLNGKPAGNFTSLFDHAKAAEILAAVLQPKPDFADILLKAASAVIGGVGRFVVADIGRSKQPLRIGHDYVSPMFDGTISEVRIWNVVRSAADIEKEITGGESGLVSLWRMEEREGKKAMDSIGANHADLKGSIQWVNAPGSVRSKLTLYLNGQQQAVERLDGGRWTADGGRAAEATTLVVPLNAANQFTVGAARLSATKFGEHFQGELEEMRIWKTVRTEEQIQDSLFRSLLERKNVGSKVVVEEQESLVAYYTFDAQPDDTTTVGDHSLLSNDLILVNSPQFLFSSAPISSDTPLVRSALAGLKTPFNGLIGSRPSVQEYADMQADSAGNLIGVFKRCYGFINDGQWNLITGYKVGDMATEWIGQVQFAPELIGFIEGAPPVPSENLTTQSVDNIGDQDDYNQASFVELVEAEETTYTYASTRDAGFDMSLEAKLGLDIDVGVTVGFGGFVDTVDIEGQVGAKIAFEQSLSWLDNATTSVGRKAGKSTSVELRGRFPQQSDTTEAAERRFMPDNVGQALVRSETADVFALRLLRNGALISFQMKPNPDIPKDWNIISFPINPTYTKQGTLDGKVGLVPDEHYPNALTYSPESSYFRPVEAYKLKNKIARAETDLKTYFDQYAARLLGIVPNGIPLPQLHKRNIVNTYVWTADGGFFAETLETMDSKEEVIGGGYDFKGMAGAYAELEIDIAGLGIGLEVEALLGGHYSQSVTKARASNSAFALNVNLDKVERDIFHLDPVRNIPVKQPGKVDAYRFMSFYLEPESEHYEAFYDKIVDPIWLKQSDDPAAVALRGAQQPGKKPPCWRVMHRVTYISRVLPPLDLTAPPSLEKTLQTLDIDSNYELIKLLEPYVADQLGDAAKFSAAIEDTLTRLQPELLPHKAEVQQYLSNYFSIAGVEGDDNSAGISERAAPNQPPIVNAGADQPFRHMEEQTDLEATVIDDRLDRPEDIFVTWEKVSGPDKPVVFEKPNAAKTKATFTQRGRYELRITASDGTLQASDTVTVIVNERPVISAGAKQEVAAAKDASGDPVFKTQLAGVISDTGLGDPDTGTIKVKWSKKSGLGTVAFTDESKLDTEATFPGRGHYLLQLSVDNGTFTTTSEVLVAVAARADRDLQALYVFEENTGQNVRNVSGTGTDLDLQIADATKVTRSSGFLKFDTTTSLGTTAAAAQFSNALKTANQISLEVWLKPTDANAQGLNRILTLSGGATLRNFTLGQNGSSFQFHLRTHIPDIAVSPNDLNASNKALAGGTAVAGQLTHLVVTRDTSGTARMYVNSVEVANRMVTGSFDNWANDFKLSLGDEVGGGAGRAWLGELHLVAVYARALNISEIQQNFDFGANTNLPPVVFAGGDRTELWGNYDWANQAANKRSIALSGRITNDRPEASNVLWEQVGGPTTGVKILDENAAQTSVEVTQKGRYVFRLTANDGLLTTSDEVVITVHCQPNVLITSGAQKLAKLNAASVVTADLAAKILDSGLAVEPADGSPNVTYEWRKASGPSGSGTIVLADESKPSLQVSFASRGNYEFLLEVTGAIKVSTAFFIAVNEKPTVQTANAAPVVTLPDNRLGISASVQTTGLGNPGDTLTTHWALHEGPVDGEVKFDKADAPTTTAEFTKGGLYILRFTATNKNNGLLSASVDVRAAVNSAPVVDISPVPASVVLVPKPLGQVQNVVVTLDATISDDGLPENPGKVTLKWSRVSGPSQGVTFVPDNADVVEARFTKVGVYVLQLEVFDGVVNTTGGVTSGSAGSGTTVKQVTVEVKAPTP